MVRRIVHIGLDSQFLQFLGGLFEEAAPGANEYIVLSPSPADALRHPPAAGRVEVLAPSPQNILALLRRRFDVNLVVAHAMGSHAAAVFARAGKDTVTVWSGWGYDYYGSGELLAPLTAEAVAGLATRPAAGGGMARRAATASLDAFARGLIRRAARRATYFSAPVPTDEPVFRAQYPMFRGRYHQLNYASAGHTFGIDGVERPTGTGVLVGNSATASNNHLDAFEVLAGAGLGDRRIVVPLTYGEPDYRDLVLERGRALFGDRFLPLVERMPLDEYNGLIAGCDIVVMNHRRQQALGNIGTALYAGAAVHLNEASPAYRFLRDEGAAVRTVSELGAGAAPRPMTEEERVANRGFVDDFWGDERVRANVASLLAALPAPSGVTPR